MVRQTVLKTAGGKTLAGSTPVPSAKYCCGDYGVVNGRYHPPMTCIYREMKVHMYKHHFCQFCGEKIRENANGKRSDC